MGNLNYNKIQSKIHKPQRLCLHCGRCMPIIDGNNMDTNKIDPDLIRGPLSVWDEFPEECGFSGWLFYEREKQKHLIRKIKEELHSLSFLPSDSLVAKNKTAKQRICELENIIRPWKKHGAQNW